MVFLPVMRPNIAADCCIKQRVPICNCQIISNNDKDEQVFFPYKLTIALACLQRYIGNICNRKSRLKQRAFASIGIFRYSDIRFSLL